MTNLVQAMDDDYLMGAILNLSNMQWTKPVASASPTHDGIHFHLFKIYQAFGLENALSVFQNTYDSILKY